MFYVPTLQTRFCRLESKTKTNVFFTLADTEHTHIEKHLILFTNLNFTNHYNILYVYYNLNIYETYNT